MSATTSSPPLLISPWKMSSHHHHHHQRRQASLHSTTPIGIPPRSVGQSMPAPLPPAQQSYSSHKSDGGSSSPNYFGLIIESNNVPPHSNDARVASRKWSPPSSSIRSVAATSPTVLPLDANPDFEAFRKRSEANAFNLSHGHLSQFSTGKDNPSSPESQNDELQSSRTVGSTAHLDAAPDVMEIDSAYHSHSSSQRQSQSSFFDMPRYDSPATLASPGQAKAQRTQLSHLDDRHPRLSLPTNRLDPPSPSESLKQAPRSSTLPTALNPEKPSLITCDNLCSLLNTDEQSVLLLDLRVYPQFSRARIRGAINLCIPTTLLKRASFTVEKLADTFTKERERRKFETWRDAKYVVVYDEKSSTLHDATSSVNTHKKFPSDIRKGKALILQGGYMKFAQAFPSMIDMSSSLEPASPSKGHSKEPAISDVAPVAGGCLMPAAQPAANPFFADIRQNMDLIGGVGQKEIKRPREITKQVESQLPQWLQRIASPSNHGQLAADKFLKIELEEKSRMLKALSPSVTYGLSTEPQKQAVQLAGIEKGQKNRYNRIWPFQHSRVRLQEVSTGACDYINASYIESAWSEKRYIATQGPIPATFEDFWKTVWQQDVRVIVMLTAESEGGQIKCHNYWGTEQVGQMKITPLSEKKVGLHPPRPSRTSSNGRRHTNPTLPMQPVPDQVPADGLEEHTYAVVRKFSLQHSGHPFLPMREITQLQYSGWPDFGAPAHAMDLLRLVEHCQAVVRSTNSAPSVTKAGDATAPRRPILVHCSAGCGRTGTFCTVDTVLDLLKTQQQAMTGVIPAQSWMDGEIDLVEQVVRDFRTCRISMVQNLGQYVLAYESILEWCGGIRTREEGRSTERRRSGKPYDA